METIIVLAVIALIAVVWARDRSNKSNDPVDTWEPPKEMHLTDKPWPYGEKLSEGKIHVKVADVAPTAPTGSENRVEAPAPGKSADDRVEAPAPVVEPAPVKKAPVKKPVAKPVAAKTPAKKAPAKKTVAKPAAKTPAKKAPAKKSST